MDARCSESLQNESSIIQSINVSELLISYLKQLSIEYVFGVPGGAIEPLYNALAQSEREGGPRSIVARHETGAAFMADGYASQTGRIGVCCATTGPGATNLITGVASAYANNVPMLVITAQTSLTTFGKGAFQESSCTGVNIVGMFEFCTRYNTLVSHADQFERKLVAALMTACGSTPGPVHLSLPLDVMRSVTSRAAPSYDIVRLLDRPAVHDGEALSLLCSMLSDAKNIVFVIGEGASEAIGSVLTAALLLKAKLVTTPHGKGLVSPYHPLFFGVVGFAGHSSAVDVLKDPELDTVVCIGTTLGEWASNGWDADLLLNNRLIHIDEQENNFTYTPMARLHVRGRIVTLFEQLLGHLNKLPKEAGGEQPGPPITPPINDGVYSFTLDDEEGFRDDDKPIKPQRLMYELSRMFPPHTRYYADTGASFAWAIHYLHPFDRRMTGSRNAHGGLFRACLEFSSMGWAIGCAVGAALAKRDQPMVCITGDGSLLMSGQEITVAVQENLPVIFVVLNDSSLGMVKHGQRLSGAESVGTDIPPVDFAANARSMGADAYTVHSPKDLLVLDGKLLTLQPRPTLLDVYIDQEAVPPISSRIRSLKESL